MVGPEQVNPANRVRLRRGVEPAVPGAALAEETATLSTHAAWAELERCLSCGTCNECGTCFVFCPDGAIRWEDGPVIDLDFCKGCGICAVECPGGALVLVNEREVAAAHA